MANTRSFVISELYIRKQVLQNKICHVRVRLVGLYVIFNLDVPPAILELFRFSIGENLKLHPQKSKVSSGLHKLLVALHLLTNTTF